MEKDKKNRRKKIGLRMGKLKKNSNSIGRRGTSIHQISASDDNPKGDSSPSSPSKGGGLSSHLPPEQKRKRSISGRAPDDHGKKSTTRTAHSGENHFTLRTGQDKYDQVGSKHTFGVTSYDAGEGSPTTPARPPRTYGDRKKKGPPVSPPSSPLRRHRGEHQPLNAGGATTGIGTPANRNSGAEDSVPYRHRDEYPTGDTCLAQQGMSAESTANSGGNSASAAALSSSVGKKGKGSGREASSKSSSTGPDRKAAMRESLERLEAMTDVTDFDLAQQKKKLLLMEEIKRPPAILSRGISRKYHKSKQHQKYDAYNPSGMERSAKREKIEELLKRYQKDTPGFEQFVDMASKYSEALADLAALGTQMTDWMRDRVQLCDPDQGEALLSLATTQMGMNQYMHDLSMVTKKELVTPISDLLRQGNTKIEQFEKNYLHEARKLDTALSALEHTTRKGKKMDVMALQESMQQLKTKTLHYEMFCSIKLRELSIMERQRYGSLLRRWIDMMAWSEPQFQERARLINKDMPLWTGVAEATHHVPKDIEAIINQGIDRADHRLLVAIAPPPKPKIKDMIERSRDSLQHKPRPPSFYSTSEDEEEFSDEITRRPSSPKIISVGTSSYASKSVRITEPVHAYIKEDQRKVEGKDRRGAGGTGEYVPPRYPSGIRSSGTADYNNSDTRKFTGGIGQQHHHHNCGHSDGAEAAAPQRGKMGNSSSGKGSHQHRLSSAGDSEDGFLPLVSPPRIGAGGTVAAAQSHGGESGGTTSSAEHMTTATTTEGRRKIPPAVPRRPPRASPSSSSRPTDRGTIFAAPQTSTSSASGSSAASAYSPRENETAVVSPSGPVQLDESGVPIYYVTVLYDWEARDVDELTTPAGAVLRLISAANDCWWLCEDEEAEHRPRGLVPANYVALAE